MEGVSGTEIKSAGSDRKKTKEDRTEGTHKEKQKHNTMAFMRRKSTQDQQNNQRKMRNVDRQARLSLEKKQLKWKK